jgi:hypothetical protein
MARSILTRCLTSAIRSRRLAMGSIAFILAALVYVNLGIIFVSKGDIPFWWTSRSVRSVMATASDRHAPTYLDSSRAGTIASGDALGGNSRRLPLRASVKKDDSANSDTNTETSLQTVPSPDMHWMEWMDEFRRSTCFPESLCILAVNKPDQSPCDELSEECMDPIVFSVAQAAMHLGGSVCIRSIDKIDEREVNRCGHASFRLLIGADQLDQSDFSPNQQHPLAAVSSLVVYVTGDPSRVPWALLGTHQAWVANAQFMSHVEDIVAEVDYVPFGIVTEMLAASSSSSSSSSSAEELSQSNEEVPPVLLLGRCTIRHCELAQQFASSGIAVQMFGRSSSPPKGGITTSAATTLAGLATSSSATPIRSDDDDVEVGGVEHSVVIPTGCEPCASMIRYVPSITQRDRLVNGARIAIHLTAPQNSKLHRDSSGPLPEHPLSPMLLGSRTPLIVEVYRPSTLPPGVVGIPYADIFSEVEDLLSDNAHLAAITKRGFDGIRSRSLDSRLRCPLFADFHYLRDGFIFSVVSLFATPFDEAKRVALRRDPVFLPPLEFTVTALMSGFNEADVLDHSILHMLKQGVNVHYIDNWSTDSTADRIAALQKSWNGPTQLTYELWPKDRPEAYNWIDILRRKEELTLQIDADWFMHVDVDEVRESPWGPDISMRHSLYMVDRLGYDGIEFVQLVFRAIKGATEFKPYTDFVQHLEYYKTTKRGEQDFIQVRAWKNLCKDRENMDDPSLPCVDIHSKGGHQFFHVNPERARKVFPVKFINRHYPIRSQAHGERKVLRERMPRYNKKERSNGWHTHYERQFDLHHADFLLDSTGLTRAPGGVIDASEYAQWLPCMPPSDSARGLRSPVAMVAQVTADIQYGYD